MPHCRPLLVPVVPWCRLVDGFSNGKLLMLRLGAIYSKNTALGLGNVDDHDDKRQLQFTVFLFFFLGYVSLIVCSNFWQLDCQKFYCRRNLFAKFEMKKWLLFKWIVSSICDEMFERKLQDYINEWKESSIINLLVLIQNMQRTLLTSRCRISSRTRQVCVYSREYSHNAVVITWQCREHISARSIRVRRSAHIVSHTCVSTNVLTLSAFPKSNFVPIECESRGGFRVTRSARWTLYAFWSFLFGFFVHKTIRPTKHATALKLFLSIRSDIVANAHRAISVANQTNTALRVASCKSPTFFFQYRETFHSTVL